MLAIGETMAMLSPDGGASLEIAQVVHLDIAGAEANVASHLARLAVRSAWAGAVGADAFGRRILETLRARGVDVALAHQDREARTGVFFKSPTSNGTEVLYYRAGSAASRLGPSFAAGLPLDTVPVVHLTGVTPALSESCAALVYEIMRVRRDARLPISFDVNFRPALWPAPVAGPALLELCRLADTVFVGRDEAETLWGTTTAAAVAAHLGPVPRLVVKDGAIGATLFAAGVEVSFVPAHVIDIVEPVGAGDAFAAGFLAASQAGAGPAELLLAGHDSAVVALSTTGDF